MADVWSQPEIPFRLIESCGRVPAPAPAPAHKAQPPRYTKDPYSEAKVCPLDIPPEKRNFCNSPTYLVPYPNGIGSVSYSGGDKSSDKIEEHNIDFLDDTFTVDGDPPRKIDDPANRSFLMSLISGKVPAEFGDQAYHVITAIKYQRTVIDDEDLIFNSDSSEYDSDSSDCDE